MLDRDIRIKVKKKIQNVKASITRLMTIHSLYTNKFESTWNPSSSHTLFTWYYVYHSLSNAHTNMNQTCALLILLRLFEKCHLAIKIIILTTLKESTTRSWHIVNKNKPRTWQISGKKWKLNWRRKKIVCMCTI